jgi:tetratricopeptide (TPR) repeat protein
MIIGREDEIAQIFQDIDRNDQKTIRLVLGEAGIGKSMLLDEIDNRIRTDKRKTHFVGYYRRSSAIRHEPSEVTYPLDICLLDLINFVKESQTNAEEIERFTNRLKKALVQFAKEEGINFAEAIVEDLVKKAGLEQTAALFRRFYNKFKETKQSITMVEEYMLQKPNLLQYYLRLFESIAKEFDEREFVLIFDNVESIGKRSIEFLIDLINFLPIGFHILIGIQTYDRRWSDSVTRKVIEDTIQTFVSDLRSQVMRLEGLSAESIGEWIKNEKNILLPLQPDLHRIKECSAGLPLLISQWLKVSKNLHYGEININDHCQQIVTLKKDLPDEEQINIDKLSVSFHPIDDQIIAMYLKFRDENPDLFYPFMERLVERGIFERESAWFRHQLIQKCFDDSLHKNRKKRYHEELSTIYDTLIKMKKQKNDIYDTESYNLDIAHAYHLYSSENYKDSFLKNLKIARYAAKIGDLDIAERCYNRCLDSSSKDTVNIKEDDKMDCIFEISKDVYMSWGRYDEAYQEFQKLLIYYKDKQREDKVADTLGSIGAICSYKGDRDQALKYYYESLEIAKRIRYPEGISNASARIGLIYYFIGDLDQALKYCKESLEIAKEINYDERIVWTSQYIAAIFFDKGECDQAMKYFENVLEMSRTTSRQERVCDTLAMIGTVHYYNGKYDQAMKYFEESLELSEKSGYQNIVASTLNSIGLVYCHSKQYDQAMKYFEESLDIAKRIGQEKLKAVSINDIGRVHYYDGKYDQAMKYFEESLDIAKRVDHKYNIVRSLNNIGLVYCHSKQYDQAMKYFEESLDIAKKMSNPWSIAESLNAIGQLHSSIGDNDQAMRYYQDSLEVSNRIGYGRNVEEILDKINELKGE